MMEYLPINLNIKNKSCLVVGGGNIALRKSKQLINAGAKLTIVAPEFHSDLQTLSLTENIELITTNYQVDQLDNKLLVIAATDDKKTNQAIYTDAEQKGIMVNVVDAPELCRFIMPSVINRSPLTIAISSGGSAPVLARMLREKIEWMLPVNIGAFLSKVKKDRKTIAKRFPKMSERRNFWEHFFESKLGWSAGDNLKDSAPTTLNLKYDLHIPEVQERTNGITIIDLGEGSLENLTIKTLELLQKADEVHLSENNYQWLNNMIRRDSALHFSDDQTIDFDYIQDLTIKLSRGNTEDGKQIVVVKSGHSFETDKKAYAVLFDTMTCGSYLRISAINERSPL